MKKKNIEFSVYLLGIVGFAALYPDARSSPHLWQAIKMSDMKSSVALKVVLVGVLAASDISVGEAMPYELGKIEGSTTKR